MTGNILLIDDEQSWGETLAEILRDEGYDVKWAKSKLEAELLLESNRKIDVSVTNLNLKSSSLVLDGQGYQILEYIQQKRPQLPRIVISSLQELPGVNKVPDGTKMAKKVVELYDRYHVDYVAVKGDIDTNKLIRKINEIISIKGDANTMNWETIIAIVVSAVSPYIATLGTGVVASVGTELGESISGGIGKLWKWIRQSIASKGDQQSRQLLNDFQCKPAQHQDELKRTLLTLVPEEDAILRKLTQNLIQDLFKLLDNSDNFTLSDLKRICSQVDVHWEDEVSSPTKEALSRWVVTYAQARRKEHELVEAMIKTNPGVFS